jgi:hypothetical protein
MGELNLEPFIKDAGRKTAILDTNLLLLKLTAALNPKMLLTFKRIGTFTIQDAILLELVLAKFAHVVTTAYVLAEVSNLANALSGDQRQDWFMKLASFALMTEESHVPTRLLGTRNETIRFGIADSALASLSETVVLITAERPLSGYLQSQGKQVLNFHNLRPLWLLQ